MSVCFCVYTQGKCILFRQTISNYMEDFFIFIFYVLWCSNNQIGCLTVVQTVQVYVGILLLLQKPLIEAMGKEYRKYSERYLSPSPFGTAVTSPGTGKTGMMNSQKHDPDTNSPMVWQLKFSSLSLLLSAYKNLFKISLLSPPEN